MRVIRDIAATPQPDAGNGRWLGSIANLRELFRRRLPERVQLRLELLRGRRLDLNLTRSRIAKFKFNRDRDEDDDDSPQHRHGGNRVFMGERGRVTAWSSSDNEVNEYTVYT